MAIKEIIYVSRASMRFEQQQLITLLTSARQNNLKSGVTGLLLYDGMGTFLQALEGTPDTVENLYQKINQDSRHERITLLWEQNVTKRSFSQWEMGFRQLDDGLCSQVEGYSDFMQTDKKDEYFQNAPLFAKELFVHFKSVSQLES